MTSRVAVPLFSLLVWAMILAFSDHIIALEPAERHHYSGGPVSPVPRTSP